MDCQGVMVSVGQEYVAVSRRIFGYGKVFITDNHCQREIQSHGYSPG